jgi:predicted  nucleic acid-binding Zn-ribbon protein
MADQIESLKRLQAIDGELYRLRRQEEEKPRELERVIAEEVAQQERVKAAEAKLKTLQLSQKEKEVELQTREASVKKLQGQLFQLKTNKEYSVMQHEIDTLKADNSLLEEVVLKLFDDIERASKERQAQQQQLGQEQERLRKERERIEREVEELRGQIGQLERSRETVVPDVPGQALSTYERVLELREGIALVPVLEASCGGCHRRLPPQVINQVYLKAELVTCESCNRILYFDETTSKL